MRTSVRRRFALVSTAAVALTMVAAVPAATAPDHQAGNPGPDILQTASITGTVTAADTGEPIEDACVYVYTAEDFDFVEGDCTDETGAYAVGGLPEGVEYKVEVGEWNTYLSQWLFGARFFDDADIISAPATIDVTLERGVRVSGTLHDPWGGPAEDVSVRFYTDDWEFITNDSTDEDGTWSSTLLPAGPFKVQFISDYGVQWAIGKASFENATVFLGVPGEPLHIEDTLAGHPGEELGNVSGTVTAARTGAPLEGICVTATAPHNPWDGEGEACTDASGNYTLDVPAGVYKFAFQDPAGDYAATYYGGNTFDEAAVVTVDAESEVDGIDAALAAAAVIEGRLLDRATRDPLADVCVYAFAADEPELITGQVGRCSDEDGYFRIGGLPGGPVKLNTDGTPTHAAQWFDRAASHEDARILRTRSGGTTKVPNFRLDQGAVVTGTVTNMAGEPIAEACVQVSYVPNSRIGGCEWGATTDADGVYTIHNVPPGDQVFGAGQLWGREYASVWNGGASHRSAAEPIRIAAGSTIQVDFALPPTATIGGDVEITEGYLSLNVYTVDGDLIGTGADLLDGEPFWPGPDGRFQIAGLPTSSVLLEVTWYDAEEWSLLDQWWYEASDSFEAATPIQVVSGQNTELTITGR